MIVPVDILEKKRKNVDSGKKKPKVKTSSITFFETLTEPIYVPIGEPLVEPSTETCDETNPRDKLTIIDGHNVNILVFSTRVNDILDKDDDSSEDLRDENPQNEEPDVQGERNVKAE
ncbi:hypothetical protein RYX36_015721 [Vicia faba]